jgi:peptide-methionine (S)-S-oxide reductase
MTAKARRFSISTAVVLLVVTIGFVLFPKPIKGLQSSMPHTGPTEIATFGGGCFWCLEAVYERISGVLAVTSGYAGGRVPHPTYEQVCTGKTGHAETVQIEYDPKKISYEQLLEIFWQAHDPTTEDRQGGDVGTQYRSVIFFHNDAQKLAAERSKKELASSGKYHDPVVTEIVPLQAFYKAEEYHQDYFRKHPNAPYCALVISPKLKKLDLH